MASGPALVYADLVLPLYRKCSTIGRRNPADDDAPTLDLAVLDRDRVVSRRHAEMAWREGAMWVVDVAARNGVTVNGLRLLPRAAQALSDNDSLGFGGLALTFRCNVAWPEGLHAEWEDANFFEPVHTVAAFSTLSGQLHAAVEQRQLLFHYQPKVLLATGELEAVECLVRWSHPTRGILYPDTFLPLAESTGYIKAITANVLDTALRQCAAWELAGLNVDVAVNISARDLEDDNFPSRVVALLEDALVLPSQLIIEVTETGVMSNPTRAIEHLNLLKSTGVRISIDDFGIGQSSLAYLKQLPADELKIDKSFLTALDAGNLAILRSAISVGHALGMRVIAEGIEDAATMVALRDMGCDVGQGYFFGRPVIAETFFDSALAQAARSKSRQAT